MSRNDPRTSSTFRPDIEGLRGVAVLAVVLFHAGLFGVGGGFVGVDVFFVLSGFLITGLLLREREQTGSIGLTAFYARRVRRLLPAATVVLVATLAAAWILLDPLTRIDVLLDGAAAALSVGNVRFALTAGDYFAADTAPSPFLQFWSLGVEEQFYLAWPLLLLVALRSPWPRLAAGALLATIFGASLGASIALTESAPNWAFYSLPARAWQLALGGLLAVAASPLARLPGLPVAGLGWAGLAAVVGSAVAFDAGTAWPGVAALAPTLGAAALILAGGRAFGPGTLLSTLPLRFLGRISYSLYLWHWPVLVLAPAATGIAELSTEASLGLAGLSVVLATATCLLIEEPFRFRLGASGPHRVRPGRTLRVGLAAVLAVAVAGGSLSVAAGRELDALSGPQVASNQPGLSLDLDLETDPPETDAPPTEPPASAPPSAPPATASPGPSAPAASPSATAAPTPAPTAPPATPRPTAGSQPVVTPPADPAVAGLQPPIGRAENDHERLKTDRCIAYEPETAPRNCAYGPKGAFTIALVGDSHVSHWFPALEQVAAANGWRIVPMIKVSCTFIDMPIYSNFYKREYRECTAFRDATIARLNKLKPDLTIVGLNKWVLPIDDSNKTVGRIGAAFARMIERIPGPVAIIVDNPHSAHHVPTCLASNRDRLARCSTPRSRSMGGTLAIEQNAAERTGVPLIDLRKKVCVADPCPAVVDGRIIYRDHHHLTATFARSLAPPLAARLAQILGG